jgi:tRNA (guanosine-2'-O-)-methyltransferase
MITELRLKKIKDVAARRQQGIIVFEDIHDPHNAAAVLRTADSFGIQKVCFIFEKGEKFNPKKVGKATSSSANKWLDFEVFDSTAKCFKTLKKRGYTIIGTILNAKAKTLLKTDFKKPKIALVFGNEHAGLSQTAIDLLDEQLYIPMQGFVQSMNLSVTAAICMYEMFRQRNPSKQKFLLSNKEQAKLISEWKRK